MDAFHIMCEFVFVLLIQLIAIGVAVCSLILLATVFDSASRSMSWFSNKWLIFGLYYCPLFFVLGMGPAMYLSIRKKVRAYNCINYLLSLQFFFSLCLERNKFELLRPNVPKCTMSYLRSNNVDANRIAYTIGFSSVIRFDVLHCDHFYKSIYQIAVTR